ncbi:MAG: hypothetical protein ACOYNN_11870 [Terrimicrobiaceae bacterium]
MRIFSSHAPATPSDLPTIEKIAGALDSLSLAYVAVLGKMENS